MSLIANNNAPSLIKSHSSEEIEIILSDSVSAYKKWKDTPFKTRVELLSSFADLLEKRKEECAYLITKEMGKIIRQSRQEIEKCIVTSRFYAERSEEFLKPEIIKTNSTKSYISYHPLGPILAVMPWNFPFWQVIRFAAPALMAGNTAILKHASNVPESALMIEDLFNNAGFEKGIFRAIMVEGKNMNSIIEDPRIKAITLTGSEGAGAKVAEAAGKTLKKTVLELGGSDPFIVLEDADLDLAVDIAVKSRMVNTGQSCIAAKRFILHTDIAKQFLEDLKERMQSLRRGNPFDESTDYGPLSKVEFARILKKQIERSVKLGANIALGGNWDERDGANFPATILTNVKPGMPAYDEELFGPVASIIIAESEDEAIRIANDTKYGLGASIWTRNVEKGEALALKIEAGSVFVNKMVSSDPQLPFGGVKMSGYGRELSYLGIREFTNIKTVNIA